MNHEARQSLRNEAALRQGSFARDTVAILQEAEEVRKITEEMVSELAALSFDRDFDTIFPKADCQSERPRVLNRTDRAISEANSLGSDVKGALRRVSGEITDVIAETKARLEKLITCAHGNGLHPDAVKTAYSDLDAYLSDLCAELVQPIEREIENRRAFP